MIDNIYKCFVFYMLLCASFTTCFFVREFLAFLIGDR